MLREGPLQRCSSCGQVFKLVRLRPEFSDDMDYYYGNYTPFDDACMGESDTFYFSWKNLYYEDESNFERPYNYHFSLINPDDHDRIITDPAYRFE